MNQVKNNQIKIISLYQQPLLAFIKRKIPNIDDADDILSKVFIQYMTQSNEPRNPIAWLYGVSKNSIVDYYRMQKHHDSLSDDYPSKEVETDPFKAFSSCIVPIINKMDDKDRIIIQLIDLDGYSQKHAVSVLNLSLSALKSRLLRARAKLRARMMQCCPPIRNTQGNINGFHLPLTMCQNC